MQEMAKPLCIPLSKLNAADTVMRKISLPYEKCPHDRERSDLELVNFGIQFGSVTLYLVVFLSAHINASGREHILLYKMPLTL